MLCKGCWGESSDLRGGVCWNCANNGEREAACRTVIQHIKSAMHNAKIGRWDYVRFDLKWALGRLTQTGDYRKGGYFDKEGYQWRVRLKEVI